MCDKIKKGGGSLDAGTVGVEGSQVLILRVWGKSDLSVFLPRDRLVSRC
jgi:hypothetical protein